MIAGLASAIDRFKRDVEMRRFDTSADLGGCWNTAHRFAYYCTEADIPYRFRRWQNLPGLRTPTQHNIEVDGLIVCWTHQQIEPADWPHIEPADRYQARGFAPLPVCDRCGHHSGDDEHRCSPVTRDPLDRPDVQQALAELEALLASPT